jgi:hypothetical protein
MVYVLACPDKFSPAGITPDRENSARLQPMFGSDDAFESRMRQAADWPSFTWLDR